MVSSMRSVRSLERGRASPPAISGLEDPAAPSRKNVNQGPDAGSSPIPAGIPIKYPGLQGKKVPFRPFHYVTLLLHKRRRGTAYRSRAINRRFSIRYWRRTTGAVTLTRGGAAR